MYQAIETSLTKVSHTVHTHIIIITCTHQHHPHQHLLLLLTAKIRGSLNDDIDLLQAVHQVLVILAANGVLAQYFPVQHRQVVVDLLHASARVCASTVQKKRQM